MLIGLWAECPTWLVMSKWFWYVHAHFVYYQSTSSISQELSIYKYNFLLCFYWKVVSTWRFWAWGLVEGIYSINAFLYVLRNASGSWTFESSSNSSFLSANVAKFHQLQFLFHHSCNPSGQTSFDLLANTLSRNNTHSFVPINIRHAGAPNLFVATCLFSLAGFIWVFLHLSFFESG